MKWLRYWFNRLVWGKYDPCSQNDCTLEHGEKKPHDH